MLIKLSLFLLKKHKQFHEYIDVYKTIYISNKNVYGFISIRFNATRVGNIFLCVQIKNILFYIFKDRERFFRLEKSSSVVREADAPLP